MKSHFLLLLVASFSLAFKEDRNFRIDCWPEENVSKKGCESRGCTYDELSNRGPPLTPACFMPREKMGYKASKVNDGEWKLTKNNGPSNPFGGGDLPSLKFSFKDIGDSVMNIRIEDNEKKRFDVSSLLSLPRSTQSTTEKLTVEVIDNVDPFSFRVKREKETIFDTSPGGLVFADKFIQLAVQLPSGNMFGWGENVHPNLKHNFTGYTKWGMFARDEGPDAQTIDTKNLYGVHPFYLAVEENGAAHGVLFLNSNSQDLITVPSPGFVYRTIGGIIDLYVFPGPSPSEVVQQYTAFVGRPALPPYWALGFQLCRYGYKSLYDLKNRVEAVRNYSIPFDVAYADIDYMERNKDFTIGANWTGFGDYVNQLHDWGMKNILIFDPAIEVDYETFKRAVEKNASFISWERPDEVPHDVQDIYPMVKDTQILLSVVWPDKHVAFPDFLDPQNNTAEWWKDEFKRFHDQIPFDGAWIDMNEPAAFGTNEKRPFYFDDPDHPNLMPLACPLTGPDSEWDAPPYKTQAVYKHGKDAFLATKTVCMRAMSGRGGERQYDVHSLYGWSESRVTADAVRAATGKRGVVISRSSFPSSGRFGGHWLGDNSATWEDLRSAVIGVMEFNLFGIPYVGSDVCGFNRPSNEELCLRWQQLGAFHSFYRNHNSDDEPAQDPAVWESVALATKRANEFRYAYLPYLYTLHYKASMHGETVVRPLFFDFGADKNTLEISEQFMWGPSILVAPVLKENATTVNGYIPSVVGVSFYSLHTHMNDTDCSYGKKVLAGHGVFPAPQAYNAPTFVRSASIIPRQPSALTTVAARKGNLNLLIVPGDDENRTANGDLYWDDGESIVEDLWRAVTATSFNFNMSASQSTLSITITLQVIVNPPLEFLEIFDYPAEVDMTSFKLNGEKISMDSQKSSYSKITGILRLHFSVPIEMSYPGTQTITWSHGSSMLTTNRVQK